MFLDLFIISLFVTTQNIPTSNKTNEAIKFSSIAYLHQSGVKKYHDEKINYYNKKINEDIRKIFSSTFFIYKTLEDKKIVYSFSW